MPKVIEVFGSTRSGTCACRQDSSAPMPRGHSASRTSGATTCPARHMAADRRISAGATTHAVGAPPNQADERYMRALTAGAVEWVEQQRAAPQPISDARRRDARDGQKRPSGFPAIPGVRFPAGLVDAVLDYDFGPEFRGQDMSGVITRSRRLRGDLRALVPRVNRMATKSPAWPRYCTRHPSGRTSGGTFRRAASLPDSRADSTEGTCRSR